MIDVLVVGSGPGGLGAAHAVRAMNPGLRVMLVEAGRAQGRRFCPVDVAKHCRGCGGICNVVSGFGGSMHYGDGIKLSLLPSGRRIIDLLGADEAQRLCDAAFGLLTKYLPKAPALIGHEVDDSILDVFANHDLHLRQYPVAVLSESQLKTVIDGFYGDLAERIDVRMETEVVGLRPDSDGFAVTVRTRRLGIITETDLHTRAVIMATGRRGLASTQKLLRGLGVPMTPPSFSCGVRFEMQADFLRATGLSHPDMKVTQRNSVNKKVKTFCFCGGTNGGRVKFTHYQKAFGDPIITLDGHETLERVAGDRPLAGNFGLMCQTRMLDADADQSTYLQETLVPAYRQLNEGRPVVQTYADFRSRTAPVLLWSDLAAKLRFEPSVHDLVTAPLDSLFSDDEHVSLVRGFEKIMRPMLELGDSTITIDEIADQVLVMGLELEFLWSHVKLDNTAQTPVQNIFVVGDAAGIAQGVVQAMMMGMRAGEAAAQRTTPVGLSAV